MLGDSLLLLRAASFLLVCWLALLGSHRKVAVRCAVLLQPKWGRQVTKQQLCSVKVHIFPLFAV